MSDRRNPALVTADRLADDYSKYFDRLSGSELVAIASTAVALRKIAEEDSQRCLSCNGTLNWSDPEMATCTRCGDEWSPDHFNGRAIA